MLSAQLCLKLVSLPTHGKPTSVYQVRHTLNPQEHTKRVSSCTCQAVMCIPGCASPCAC